jgi:K+-sensing histidine kinase KdpD
MNGVAAAVRITSTAARDLIERAAAYGRQCDCPCFVISIVSALPYGASTDEEAAAVRENLAIIEAANACPIMQEGSDVATTLRKIADVFGVRALFLHESHAKGSIAEQLVRQNPSFDVIIVGQRNRARL